MVKKWLPAATCKGQLVAPVINSSIDVEDANAVEICMHKMKQRRKKYRSGHVIVPEIRCVALLDNRLQYAYLIIYTIQPIPQNATQ